MLYLHHILDVLGLNENTPALLHLPLPTAKGAIIFYREGGICFAGEGGGGRTRLFWSCTSEVVHNAGLANTHTQMTGQ